VRRLPRTPVYYRDARGREEEPGLDRQLSGILKDGRFHDVRELLDEMSVQEVAAGVDALLGLGHAFDVVGGLKIRLRMRESGEKRQRVVDVVGALDFFPIEFAVVGEAGADSVVPEGGGGSPVVEGASSNGLVLSDPPESLTMPAPWVAGMTSAILSTRGAGKTYLAGVFVEELRKRVPDVSPVVFDPTGAWWGVTATASGEAASDLGVVLIGGERGVSLLDARAGARVADLVRSLAPKPVILDLSKMSKSEMHTFAADFFERIWALSSFQVHAVLDEADIFIPQRFGGLGKDERRCSKAVEEYFLRGRKSGKGGTIISLRPAVVSKNVLSVCECLFLLRLTEPNDLRAVATWLENFEHGVSESQRRECLSQMPVLPTGTAYFLRGGEHATFRRFRTRPKLTYDSSKTLGSAGSVVADVARSLLPDEVLAAVKEAASARPAVSLLGEES